MRPECTCCGHLAGTLIPSSCDQGKNHFPQRIGPCPDRFELNVKSESDPTGRKPNDPGAKLDQGKNRLGLVMFGFSKALQAVGRVGTYGAQKYSDNGWMQVPDGAARYTDAMLRHLMSEAEGEEIDPSTGLMHAAQTAWNALSRLELMLREKETKESK